MRQKVLDTVEKASFKKGRNQPNQEYKDIESQYKLKEEKRARKLMKKNNFETKVLLEASSDDEGDDQYVNSEDNLSQTSSTKELKRVLNSVHESEYEARHHQMITELRIRKMLAREKIRYPSMEAFDSRKAELRKLYNTLNAAATKVD